MSARGPDKWKLLAALAALGIALDQWTKYLAVERLTSAFARVGAHGLEARLAAFFRLRYLEPLATEPYYVFRPFWRMNYVENPAAAFSMFSFVPPDLRYRLFLLVSVAAIGFVFYYYRRLATSQRFLQVALAFVLAGTVGNLVDRLARRYVIDFVEWYWWNRPDLRWPTFNVADSLLVVGIAMLLVHPAPKAAPGSLDLGPGNKRTASRV
ncbi:signal peptidase II [Anaeromyxobacter diazotrophicus]|uniref:Lipoprotein signal peptidase n=1 Tax=Anaeromyxobacter diazotrophicus TaxID=2590199 RepID=A0A7I9VNC3_9BACT|nr:signal peptidase II [Anaeromyxobacter diazotrophicus]GEJ57708.1 lipoprotein signal peptidase [Anaeromyxobacter diazotrophicus]